MLRLQIRIIRSPLINVYLYVIRNATIHCWRHSARSHGWHCFLTCVVFVVGSFPRTWHNCNYEIALYSTSPVSSALITRGGDDWPIVSYSRLHFVSVIRAYQISDSFIFKHSLTAGIYSFNRYIDASATTLSNLLLWCIAFISFRMI